MMNRGDRREPIFRDDEDRQRFLTTLGEVCGKLAGACPVPDAESFSSDDGDATGESGRGDEMVSGHLHGTVQPATPGVGHLFSGRYKALVVDGRGSGYLKTVCDYVHLNPSRVKLLKADQALREYRWSGATI